MLCTREQLLKSYHGVPHSCATLNLQRRKDCFIQLLLRNVALTQRMQEGAAAAPKKRRLQGKGPRPGPHRGLETNQEMAERLKVADVYFSRHPSIHLICKLSR